MGLALAVLFYVGLGAIILSLIPGNPNTDKMSPEETRKTKAKNNAILVAGGAAVGLAVVMALGLSYWGGRHGNEWFRKPSPFPTASSPSEPQGEVYITNTDGQERTGTR